MLERETQNSNCDSEQLTFDDMFLSFEYANKYLSERFPGVTVEDLRKQNRRRELVLPRQELIRHYGLDISIPTDLISPFIQRDRKTIWHALHKPQQEIDQAISSWINPEEQKPGYAEQKKRDLELNNNNNFRTELDLKSERYRRDKIFAEIAVERVAHHYGVSPEDIVSERSGKTETQPRKTSVHILRDGTEWSWLSIANYMGRKDHSTAIYFYQRVEARLESDPEYKERYDELLAEINRLTERTLRMSYNGA